MRAQRSSELLSPFLPCALLAGFTARLCLQDIRSLDYWWHLKTGEWIAEHGRVPTADLYTCTVRGARWIGRS